MRPLLVVVTMAVVGCGRVGFDPPPGAQDALPGPGPDGAMPGDGSTGDPPGTASCSTPTVIVTYPDSYTAQWPGTHTSATLELRCPTTGPAVGDQIPLSSGASGIFDHVPGADPDFAPLVANMTGSAMTIGLGFTMPPGGGGGVSGVANTAVIGADVAAIRIVLRSLTLSPVMAGTATSLMVDADWEIWGCP